MKNVTSKLESTEIGKVNEILFDISSDPEKFGYTKETIVKAKDAYKIQIELKLYSNVLNCIKSDVEFLTIGRNKITKSEIKEMNKILTAEFQ